METKLNGFLNAKKFTFKTIKPTGSFSTFEPDEIIIKLNKKQCGNIIDKSPHKIRLQVIKKDILEDGNKNCIWKWIQINRDFTSVDEAKTYLNENFEKITALNLYLSE